MAKKIKIAVITVILLLLISVISTVLFLLSVLPKDCEALSVNLGCTEFEESQNDLIKPFATLSFSKNLYEDMPVGFEVLNFFNKIAFGYYKIQFDNLKLKKTEDHPTDVEYMEVQYFSPSGSADKKVFMYDFYLCKYYCLKDGDFYEVKNPKKLNKLFYKVIKTFGFDEDSFDERWRGQSTYQHEEFSFDGKDYVFDCPTFRNNVPWSLKENLKSNETYMYRDSDFENTEKTSVNTSEEAIAAAAKELGFESPYGFTYYDKTCGYWLVELYDDKGYAREKSQEYYRMLCDEVMTVIIDNEGKTLETYQSLTTCRQFWIKDNSEK